MQLRTWELQLESDVCASGWSAENAGCGNRWRDANDHRTYNMSQEI